MISYAIYTIITLICIRSHICSFILRFSYFSLIHIFLYFYYACIYSFIYSYMSIEPHITVFIFLYNTYIPIFFSCIHLLVHIFIYTYHSCTGTHSCALSYFYLSLSFLAFMHFYHVFLTCSIYSFRHVYHIFISCYLLVTFYILLTSIFMYFIRLSYLMTYTYTLSDLYFIILSYLP